MPQPGRHKVPHKVEGTRIDTFLGPNITSVITNADVVHGLTAKKIGGKVKVLQAPNLSQRRRDLACAELDKKVDQITAYFPPVLQLYHAATLAKHSFTPTEPNLILYSAVRNLLLLPHTHLRLFAGMNSKDSFRAEIWRLNAGDNDGD